MCVSVSLEAGRGLWDGFRGTVRSCMFVSTPVNPCYLVTAHGEHSGHVAMGASPGPQPWDLLLLIFCLTLQSRGFS